MCYSLETSQKSAITGFLTSIILYKFTFNQNKQTHLIFKSLALFFLFVSLMQVYDWIFWLNPFTNQENLNINFIFTKIAMISNHLQPIILALVVSLYTKLNYFTKLTVFIYTIVALFYSIYAYNKITYTVVTDKSSPALEWEWNNLPGAFYFYALFLFTFCVVSFNLPFPFNYILFFINIATFTFSYYTLKKNIIGRIWCKIVAYIPLLFIIIQYLHQF